MTASGGTTGSLGASPRMGTTTAPEWSSPAIASSTGTPAYSVRNGCPGGLVEADSALHVTGEPVGVVDAQDRADTVFGAIGPASVDALEFPECQAAGTYLGQQARPAGGVHEILGAEVAGRGRGGVVPVAGDRGSGLEVGRDRVSVGVGERLTDQTAADHLPVRGDPRALGAGVEPGELGERDHHQRVAEAEQHREHEQGTGGRQVAGHEGRGTHHAIPGRNWTSRSMSLIPMNGTRTPPAP